MEGPRGTLILGHGIPPPPPSDALAAGWDLTSVLLGLAVVAGYAAVAQNARRPVPRARTAAFVSGVAVVVFAVGSPLDAYAGALLSVHMVQHLLLTLVAAPLILLGRPLSLARRSDRGRRTVPRMLRSPIAHALSHPILTWALYAIVLWGTHFTPVYQAALENDLVHVLEHAAYLAAALLFWFPVLGTEPSPWRLPYPARLLYLFLAGPLGAFLGLAINQAASPLYAHYATLERTWGPTPLADQQAAGLIMWIAGGLGMLLAILLVAAAWARSDRAAADRFDSLARSAEAATGPRASSR
ncbi:MAG TPA: cytochrome c oxidase assembly protein [Actinomycetota bacterium]|nr:cytochrome c oxidase assembly protein [Actinomycetota bacterium]